MSDTEPHVPLATDRLTLAGSDVGVPPLGVGTWAWGDRDVWGMGGYDDGLTMDTIRDAWDACFDTGVVLFDTAEVYGKGESERIIGRLLDEHPERRDRAVVATKFMPMPWKVRVTHELLASLRASLGRLGLDSVDLYQLHGPVSLRSKSALADALAAAHGEGLIKAIGVSNYSVKEMASIDDELRKRGLRLATNQIEFSLLRRTPETSGLLAACREREVLPLAYSPIGQGRLTGKYSAANPPSGSRNFGDHPMEQIDRIVAELRRIGDAHDGRTPSQVALNWIVAKGAIPIPGAKNRRQAEENAGGIGWRLTDDEVATLDELALEGRRKLALRIWQHG